MKIGVRKAINKVYINYLVFLFGVRRFLFGFENANQQLRVCDKRVVIPILRKYGATIGDDCDIESPLILHNCRDSYVNLTIGKNCHVGKEVFFDLRAPIIIEDFVTISMRATVITHFDVGKGPLKGAVSRSIASEVVLRKGCYIGANAILLHGVTVGGCALVSAGAVVTKDVLPYYFVAGVPAKRIRELHIEDV